MKTALYIMIALFMGANLTSCTTDSIAEIEEVPADVLATEGDDGQVVDDPDDD